MYWAYPILPFGIVACTVFPTTFLEIAVYSRLSNVISPEAHCHADDTQLYVSFKPDDANAEDEAVRAMEDCIKDVTNWLIEGRLLLDDKTEFLVIRTRQQ